MFQKIEREKKVQTCPEHECLKFQKGRLKHDQNLSQKEVWQSYPNLLKTWISKGERRIRSNMPKTKDEMKKRR